MPDLMVSTSSPLLLSVTVWFLLRTECRYLSCSRLCRFLGRPQRPEIVANENMSSYAIIEFAMYIFGGNLDSDLSMLIITSKGPPEHLALTSLMSLIL